MKTKLLIIMVFLSINCTAQNRFDKEFTKADNAFLKAGLSELISMYSDLKVYTHRNDSIKLEYALHEMTDNFLKLAQSIGNFRYNNWNLLSKAENQRLGNLQWSILNNGEDILVLSTFTSVMDDIQAAADSVSWEDDIRNPENAEFVDEVSFNEDIPFDQVTQEQFNKRYEIKMNTKKIKTLEQVHDAINIVENARAINGLTPTERSKLETASVKLRNLERSIIRIKTSE